MQTSVFEGPDSRLTFYCCLLTLFENGHDSKKGLMTIVMDRIFFGHQGPRCLDIPDPSPGMSRTETSMNPTIKGVRGTGAINKGCVQLKGGRFLLQGPRFPFTGPSVRLTGPRFPSQGPFLII